MDTMTEIGERIRRLMPFGMSQRQLAERAGMTPDALSRALNGQRGLSPLEVAAIAENLGADTHWLITGTSDPFAVLVAARHTWDARRRARVNDGQQEDQSILDQITLLYRAAFPQGPLPSTDLPTEPEALRTLLGDPFVRTFASTVEERLGIDVIRIPGLTTDYSIRIGPRAVVVLATQAAWFRSNWSLAHELGHLAHHHHHAYDSTRRRTQRDEKQADAFAAAVLLPHPAVAKIAAAGDEPTVAAAVWDLGVSTEAIRHQLRGAKLLPPQAVSDALNKTTPRLLRDNAAAAIGAGPEAVVVREQGASARRFPATLLSALQAQTERGAASPELLAWALDVPVDDLDFPEPDESAAAADYARMLHDRPSPDEWSAWLAARTGR